MLFVCEPLDKHSFKHRALHPSLHTSVGYYYWSRYRPGQQSLHWLCKTGYKAKLKEMCCFLLKSLQGDIVEVLLKSYINKVNADGASNQYGVKTFSVGMKRQCTKLFMGDLLVFEF